MLASWYNRRRDQDRRSAWGAELLRAHDAMIDASLTGERLLDARARFFQAIAEGRVLFADDM